MPRRSSSGQAQSLLVELRGLLDQFETQLNAEADLRAKVLALIPAVHKLRDLGSSLIPVAMAQTARERILLYFHHYPRTVIQEGEITVVAGINDWPRRLRELRVEQGWKIFSGTTIKEMIGDGELPSEIEEQSILLMKPNDYILLNSDQDRDSAHRWNIANDIRKQKGGARDKILKFFRANVGQAVTGEELRYVANTTEWGRRVRELRTEYGWPIYTKQTGRPDLSVGEYVLEEDRQAFEHDRKIPDEVRREVILRDHNTCINCGWNQAQWSTANPRYLELHHLKPHVEGGSNEAGNLITLCNVCHNKVHAKTLIIQWPPNSSA